MAAEEGEGSKMIETNLNTNPEKKQQLVLDFATSLSSESRPRTVSQVLPVLVVSIGSFIHGTSVVFPAVSLPGILADANETLANLTNQTYIGFTIDPTQDVSWIVSIASFGMLFGCIVAAPLSNSIGRRMTSLLGVGVTFAIAYCLVVTATHVGLLYLSRFLMGSGLGVSTTVSTLYIQDIATPELRGSLGAIPGVVGCLGIIAYQVAGAFLNWRYLNLICACVNLPFMVLLFLIPESPVFLVARGKLDSAHKVLRTLRGPGWNITRELTDIKARLEVAGSSKPRVTLATLATPRVLKPLLIGLTLMFLMQMSGINLIMQYSVQIFQTADSSINEFIATIYLGMALLASNILTMLLAHKLPRRLLLLTSSMGLAVTLAVMGACYQLKEWESDCKSRLVWMTAIDSNATTDSVDNCNYIIGWLPLLDLMVYIFVFNLGYGAMVWITVIEILPAHVREFCNSLCVAVNCPVSFLTSYTYPYLMQWVGGQGTFWLYSVVSLLGFVFIAFCVPETRGKTEEEIQKHFQDKREETEKPATYRPVATD